MVQTPTPRARLLRLLIALPVIGVAAYFIAPYVGSYNSLRNKAVNQVGVARLQEWAVEVMDKPEGLQVPPDVVVSTQASRPTPRIVKNLPGDIQPLSSGPVFYYAAVPDLQIGDYLMLNNGSVDYRYGLVVGRKGFEPIREKVFEYEQLGDGVWGMYPK